MPSLVSPDVSVTIIDESFYVPGNQATVPLIFIATADEKLQPDNLTPALGTFEYGVVREVTSIAQSVELYGVPRFLESSDGRQHHGDARNEYGLDALNKFLEIGNRAYVVRGNVNLADDLPSIKTLWSRKLGEAADYLNILVADYIVEYNNTNNLFPLSVGYKASVDADELKVLVDEALSDLLLSYSFSSDAFENAFIMDHSVDHAGYQDVCFDTSGGFLQGTDFTGLENDATVYGVEIDVVDTGGVNTVIVSFAGSVAQSFDDLMTEIQAQLFVATTDPLTAVELIQGKIRITSGLDGVTSAIEIVNDGPSGTLPLFQNVVLFEQFADPVAGLGPNSLNIYDDTFTTILGGYDGVDELIDTQSTGSEVSTEFTADEAEGMLLAAGMDFDNTAEFQIGTSLGSRGVQTALGLPTSMAINANDAAKRLEIVTQMQAVINDPATNVRGENLEYNIVICPGYWETSDEMIRLSEDIYEEVFVIGDTPFDKAPTGPNGLVNWATSTSKTSSYHLAYYYPHGITSNIDGVNIMTTGASTALRVYAVNDRDTEVWFAPAGIQRGTAPHLVSVGYVSGALGGPTDFVEDYINKGTRDSLYEFPKNINPITFLTGRGIMVLGQKTTYGATSALDRVNVSRLVKFIKRSLRKALFPFLFEPNDSITRENVKAMVDSFLIDLIDRRGLYDFATVCDLSNNTPVRIDRNELWIDVAIKPVKAVEFIYVPIRVVTTGADIGGRDIVVGA